MGAERSQVGSGISNWGKEISNRGRDYKLGQEGYQIGEGITNRCRTQDFPLSFGTRILQVLLKS